MYFTRSAAQLIALLKGAGHKYLKRVPAGVTKTGKTRYRYYYHVGHGNGIGHADHFQVGAAFAYKDGHYHVTASDGDTVTVKHDETGETRTVSKEALTKMLHEHHAEARQAHKERLHREIKAAEAAGATRQHARLMKEAQKHGFAPKAKPQPKAQKGAKMQDQEVTTPGIRDASREELEAMARPRKRTPRTLEIAKQAERELERREDEFDERQKALPAKIEAYHRGDPDAARDLQALGQKLYPGIRLQDAVTAVLTSRGAGMDDNFIRRMARENRVTSLPRDGEGRDMFVARRAQEIMRQSGGEYSAKRAKEWAAIEAGAHEGRDLLASSTKEVDARREREAIAGGVHPFAALTDASWKALHEKARDAYFATSSGRDAGAARLFVEKLAREYAGTALAKQIANIPKYGAVADHASIASVLAGSGGKPPNRTHAANAIADMVDKIAAAKQRDADAVKQRAEEAAHAEQRKKEAQEKADREAGIEKVDHATAHAHNSGLGAVKSPTRSDFYIGHHDGARKVSGTVLGDFGLHSYGAGGRKYHTITHLPTGFGALPPDMMDKAGIGSVAEAKALLKHLHDNVGGIPGEFGKQPPREALVKLSGYLKEHEGRLGEIAGRSAEAAKDKRVNEGIAKRKARAIKAASAVNARPGAFNPRRDVQDKDAAVKRASTFALKAGYHHALTAAHHDGEGSLHATDGHRLVTVPVDPSAKAGYHVQEGAKESPRDDDKFPDVSVVYPKSFAENTKVKHDFDAGALQEVVRRSEDAFQDAKAHDGHAFGHEPLVAFHVRDDGTVHAEPHIERHLPTEGVSLDHYKGAAKGRPVHSGKHPENGRGQSIYVNAKYLKDALKGAKGTVRAHVYDPHQPLAFHREDGEHHVIMPTRVK